MGDDIGEEQEKFLHAEGEKEMIFRLWWHSTSGTERSRQLEKQLPWKTPGKLIDVTISHKKCPTRWVGHQTLGRAHLGLGNLEAALICFQKAVKG